MVEQIQTDKDSNVISISGGYSTVDDRSSLEGGYVLLMMHW
jgi:hypothetical protein